MENIRPVEVVGIDMRKMPKDTWDQPHTDQLEPVFGDQYSVMVAGCPGILVLPIFLRKDCSLSLVGFQVWKKNMQPQFVLQSLTLMASIVLDSHKVGMFHVIRKPRCKNWPPMADFAVGKGSQTNRIDVSSLGKLRDQLQHYVGDFTQHLPFCILLASVIGFKILLECGRHHEEAMHIVRGVAGFVPYRGMDIPNGQADLPCILVAREVRELHLVWSTDWWNNYCPQGKSILCLPPPGYENHFGMHSIALHVCGPYSSVDCVVCKWVLAQEVLRTFYRVSKIWKPPTVWCGDECCSPWWQLVIHPGDMIVHHPSAGVGIVVGILASTFIHEAIHSWLEIVGINKSDGLCEVFSTIPWLPEVIDEILELIVIGIVTDGPPSCGMHISIRSFHIHRGFPWVTLLRIGLLGWTLGSRDTSVGSIIFGVSFHWTFVECSGEDTGIQFWGFCKTLLMWWVELSMWGLALWIAGRRRQLTLIADSQMALTVSPPDNPPHPFGKCAFGCV